MGINVLIDMFDENDNNLFMLKYFEYKNIKIDKNTMLDTLYMCLKSGNYVYKIRFELIQNQNNNLININKATSCINKAINIGEIKGT